VSKSILTKTDPNKKSTNARLAEILKECAQAEKISAKEKELATIGEEAEPESAVYLPDLNPKDKTQSFYPKRYHLNRSSSLPKHDHTANQRMHNDDTTAEEASTMIHETDPAIDSNVSALKRLRAQPRGTNVEARIAAIKNILGEREVFNTLQQLRWPKGVICPRCHSTNVVRRDPPPNATDGRYYYECLECKGAGDPTGFDDLTGLPINQAFHALQQWILCWYLIGFCSVTQVAQALGLSVAEVMQMAQLGTQLTELPLEKDSSSLTQTARSKAREALKEKHQQVEEDELRTRSVTRGKYKPGPKSSA